nr:hypothetical protein [Comamonas thiooxydans]
MSTYLIALAFALNLAATVVAVVVAVRAMTEARRVNASKDADREYLLWLQDHIARGVELLARGCSANQDQAGMQDWESSVRQYESHLH